MDKNYCIPCKINVNFASYAKSVEHFRSAKHLKSVTNAEYTPTLEEENILKLSKDEALEIMRPKKTPDVFIPMQLYANVDGKTFKVYSEITGNIIGK